MVEGNVEIFNSIKEFLYDMEESFKKSNRCIFACFSCGKQIGYFLLSGSGVTIHEIACMDCFQKQGFEIELKDGRKISETKMEYSKKKD